MSLEIIESKTLSSDADYLCYLGSAATWEGFNMSAKNLNDFEYRVEKLCHWKNRRIYITTGKEMNEFSKLTGDNAYPEHLNIVSIALEDVEDCMPLKMRLKARWLDDIIANNESRESEEDED